ncbi:hypothetical protein C8F04DRAFT_1249649 [Mycena alexandri]|uniref:Uncharacterized protein n=1 Tax=Mycena alexandri TaxID=1745969 RepID=A0AAD6TH43_9AGAR|nr:hypothetical protein C8F04DRAFT_1249649 [Mycena alexandri]
MDAWRSEFETLLDFVPPPSPRHVTSSRRRPVPPSAARPSATPEALLPWQPSYLSIAQATTGRIAPVPRWALGARSREVDSPFNALRSTAMSNGDASGFS